MKKEVWLVVMIGSIALAAWLVLGVGLLRLFFVWWLICLGGYLILIAASLPGIVYGMMRSKIGGSR